MITQNTAIRVRVIAANETVESLAEDIAHAIEAVGYEVIEVSRSYPLREPEENKSRVYITAIPEGR